MRNKYKKLLENFVKNAIINFFKNGKICEETTTASIDGYSTPFWVSPNDYNDRVLSMMKKLGFEKTCTARKRKTKKMFNK